METAQLENLIAMVSGWVENYCRRPLRQPAAAADYYYSSDGGQWIYLRAFPTDSATFAIYSAPEGTTHTSADLIDPGDYVIDNVSGLVKLIGRTFHRGVSTVKVTDKPGYTLSTMPQAIRLAVMDLVIMTLSRKDLSTEQEQSPSGMVRFERGLIPARVRSLLSGYVWMGDIG